VAQGGHFLGGNEGGVKLGFSSGGHDKLNGFINGKDLAVEGRGQCVFGKEYVGPSAAAGLGFIEEVSADMAGEVACRWHGM